MKRKLFHLMIIKLLVSIFLILKESLNNEHNITDIIKMFVVLVYS